VSVSGGVDAPPAGPEGGGGGPGGLKTSAARGGAAVVGSRLVVQFLTLAVTFLVARILSPHDYAVLTCAAVFLAVADTLSVAGIGPALVQKPHLGEGDLEEGFTLSLGLSLAFFAALFAAAGPLAAYFRYPELKAVVRVCSLTLLLHPFRTVSSAVLERQVRLGRHSAIFTASAVAQSGANLAAALAGLGYWTLVISYCVARVLDTAAFSWLAGWKPRLRRPGPSSRGLLRFGLHVTWTTLLWLACSQSDFAIAAKLVGPESLGYYGLAFQIILLPTTRLAGSFNQVAYTVFCRLQDRRDLVRDWYLRLAGLMGAAVLPVFAGIALTAGDGLAVVLGPKWAPAVTPLRWLCLPGYVLFLMTTLLPVMNALGRADLAAKHNAAYTLVMPAAFYLLGRRYGLVGICAAWAVCYPVVSAALVSLSRPVLGFGFRELARSQLPALASAALMAAAVLGVQRALPGAGLGPQRLAAGVAAGAAVYAAAVLALARKTVGRDLSALVKAFKG